MNKVKEVFRAAVKELVKGDPVVVATVVHTKGSTPQKPGAKLLVRNDGSGVGTLGGGCVEGDIWFAAKEILKRDGHTEFRDYELNEDLAADEGLVCGGTMYFLIDPVHSKDIYMSFAREIENAYQGEGAVALATLIKPAASDGESRPLGSKLLIRENTETEGSLGSTELDLEASQKGLELMAHGRNEYVIGRNGAEYFVEAYTTPPQLILCGGGHVSKSIASLAKVLGFKIFVTDDRGEFANGNRFPEADIIIVEKPEHAIPKLPVNANTFIIIATRGHRYDNVALEAAALTPAKYVGLLGSKRKTVLIYDDLIRSGLSIDRIKEIRSPVGLDINGRTPDEIAVSVVAEMLMFRLGGTGAPMKLDEWRVDRIFDKIPKSASVN